MKNFIVLLVVGVFFTACTGSPKNAFAVQTYDYGQCRSLDKGERISYKKKPVSYICEDSHFLYGKPYKKEDIWYFKSGIYEGSDVKELSSTKVDKTLYNICQFEASYGTGSEKIRKFYFSTKLKACLPFEWSGKDGIAPFDSKDECEAKCYY